MTYTELVKLPTYAERLEALSLRAKRFDETFGDQRWLNQVLYSSYEWRQLRNQVITRDNGWDLAVPGLDICGRVYIHHIEPITIRDIETRSGKVLNLDNLVCCSYNTHNQIHYGVREPRDEYVERFPNDTSPWKLNKEDISNERKQYERISGYGEHS